MKLEAVQGILRLTNNKILKSNLKMIFFANFSNPGMLTLIKVTQYKKNLISF